MKKYWLLILFAISFGAFAEESSVSEGERSDKEVLEEILKESKLTNELLKNMLQGSFSSTGKEIVEELQTLNYSVGQNYTKGDYSLRDILIQVRDNR